MLRLEALLHFCKALCMEAFSAKRQVGLSLQPLPCVTAPSALQLSLSLPEVSVKSNSQAEGYESEEKRFISLQRKRVGWRDEDSQIVTTELSLASVTCSHHTGKL